MSLPMRVVVAEDNPDLRAFIATGLRCDGHEVLEVNDGLELIRCVGSGSRAPDLVISDVRMPGLGGLEALAVLRNGHRSFHMLMMSAYDDDETRREAKRLGVEVFIRKPLDIFELRETVWNILATDQQPAA